MASAALPLRGSSIGRFHEFSLLALLSSGYLAVATSGYLDPSTTLVTACALLLRLLMTAGVLRLEFPPTILTTLALVYVGFYAIDYFFVSREFLPATVHLVFFLAIIKVLSARDTRDYFYIKVIAFLEMLAASVLASGPGFFVFLALFLLSAVATFASGEILHSSRNHRVLRSGMRAFSRRLSLLILFLSLGILALTFAMFFVLPRTARAAIQRFGSNSVHVPGFSSEVRLGQIGEFQRLGTPVMHIRINDGSPATSLKWRGSALAEFDGSRWFNSNIIGEALPIDRKLLLLGDASRPWRNGRRINYDVELRSLGADVLFFAGVPESIQIDARILFKTPNDGYRLGLGALEGVRYTAGSLLDESGAVGGDLALTPARRELYLSLPDLDPRIPDLARSWTAGAASDLDRTRAIETRLRTGYGYSLKLLSVRVRDPLAHFLFVRRQGHCEYFASSMAVMLRAVGIPSRVVTGFQSGVFNPISGWQLIRSSDAHSWVEAFLPGQGWTTFDPTPPDPAAGALSLWTKFTLYVDAVETFWEEWVVNYDFDRQMSLATRLEQSGRSLRFGWFESTGARAALGLIEAREFLKRYGVRILAGIALAVCAAGMLIGGLRLFERRGRVNRLRRG
ncbi:MAG: DUF3488 and transglutaminase-like domain-containing protein, partial [Acidobacteria bacterium]|nr:DUF3488 and transglutaminase-like domain-containing protein [Acidobacteriota bacterium]